MTTFPFGQNDREGNQIDQTNVAYWSDPYTGRYYHALQVRDQRPACGRPHAWVERWSPPADYPPPAALPEAPCSDCIVATNPPDHDPARSTP